MENITQPRRNDRHFVDAGRKNPRDWVISSRLGYFVEAGRKKICESNFNVDEMENQRVQKKLKNALAKTENIYLSGL